MSGSSLANKRKQDRLRARLKDLRLKKPGNNICADCGVNGPTWASYNLGVFICIKCAGFHRSIGTHVTKVRSTKLDKWEADWVKNMECIGNRVANYLFEGKLTPPEKINQWASDPMKDHFIRSKYERRKWFLNRPLDGLDKPAANPPAKAAPSKPAAPKKPAPAPRAKQADLLNFGAPQAASEPPSGMFAGLAIDGKAAPAPPVAAPRPPRRPAAANPQQQAVNDAPQLLDFAAAEAPPPVQRVPSDDSVDLLSLAPAAPAAPSGQSAFGFLNAGPVAPVPAGPASSGFAFLNAAPAPQPAAPAASGSAFGFINQPAPTSQPVPLAPTPAAPASSSAFGFMNWENSGTPAPAIPSQPSAKDNFLTSLPQPAKPRVLSGGPPNLRPMMPQQPMRPMMPQQPMRPMVPQQPMRGFNQAGIFGDAMADLMAPADTTPVRNSKKRNSGSGSPKRTPSNSIQGDPFGKLLSGTGLKSP